MLLLVNLQGWPKLDTGMRARFIEERRAHHEIVLSGHVVCTALPMLECGNFIYLLFTVDPYGMVCYSTMAWS